MSNINKEELTLDKIWFYNMTRMEEGKYIMYIKTK